MKPSIIDEVARRTAAATGQPDNDWRIAAAAWWAAGHDLDRLQRWAASPAPISPDIVLDALARMQASNVPPDPPPHGRVPDLAGSVLAIAVSAAAAAVAVAVAWRIIRWAIT